jgi:hypothetical protein
VEIICDSDGCRAGFAMQENQQEVRETAVDGRGDLTYFLLIFFSIKLE